MNDLTPHPPAPDPARPLMGTIAVGIEQADGTVTTTLWDLPADVARWEVVRLTGRHGDPTGGMTSSAEVASAAAAFMAGLHDAAVTTSA
ncbi:hypothetical protein ACLQ2R_03300 [Streptosporangium sp. DT93]|uniref:hypothetical protein n=1 Tax=Streptosporangium sp. DT93 TaxID=3393428 RepID=UPI003CEFA121